VKISTKARYSLRVLIDLAEHKEDGYIPLNIIAQRQGISKNYLDQIMMLLNRSDYLKTNRGVNGGYMLAKPASHYVLGDILRITESNFMPVFCQKKDKSACDKISICKAHNAWAGLYNIIRDYLDNLTLQDILDKGNEHIEFNI